MIVRQQQEQQQAVAEAERKMRENAADPEQYRVAREARDAARLELERLMLVEQMALAEAQKLWGSTR
jgi:hypothetical protein